MITKHSHNEHHSQAIHFNAVVPRSFIHMYILDLSMRLVRSFARPGLAAGLVASALLSACGLPESGSLNSAVNNPPAESFAVLANAAITCTNGTINGSAGTFLAPQAGSITLTSCSVTATDVGDSAAVNAYN